MPGAGTLRFCAVAQPIVARPSPLWNLAVTFTESYGKIERILFMRLFVMRGFMEFWD